MQEATASMNVFMFHGARSIGSYTRRNNEGRDFTNEEVQETLATATYGEKFYASMRGEGSSHQAAAAAVTASIPGTSIVEQIDEVTKAVDTRPAPPSPQAQPQQEVQVVRGKYKYWVYNHPQAPLTPTGQKSVMVYYRSKPPKLTLHHRWADPSEAASDGKQKGPWDGEWVKDDVDKSMLEGIKDI
jgi:hypothetical protein|tara:strand:+ start:7204 stop:7761 length:558 start_codon:yes stop_codon:yes gene_type:complete